MKRLISITALVAFLVACGGGGGAKALADVTDAMFNALVARVTANESSIVALQTATPPPVPGAANLVNDAQEVVGEIVGVMSTGRVMVLLPNGYVVNFRNDMPGDSDAWDTLYFTSLNCDGIPYVTATESFNASTRRSIYPVANSWTRTADIQFYRMATRTSIFSTLQSVQGSSRVGNNCIVVPDLSAIGPLGQLNEVDPIKVSTTYQIQ
jgi:hypothetical protein